jgi:dihydroxyacetone kinase-like protein
MMAICLIAALEAIGAAILSNKEELTSLDAAIGDADHGINMARGFQAVSGKLSTLGEPADAGTVLKTVGMTLITTVGGASGPLYGTAFLRAAAVGQGKNVLSPNDVGAMLAAAIGGIKERGKAVRGEKTMLDALEPAYEAFTSAERQGRSLVECLAAARESALDGVMFTKTIIATKGRASYLGERSIGHQDPGATSSYLMLAALEEFCRSQEQGGA